MLDPKKNPPPPPKPQGTRPQALQAIQKAAKSFVCFFDLPVACGQLPNSSYEVKLLQQTAHGKQPGPDCCSRCCSFGMPTCSSCFLTAASTMGLLLLQDCQDPSNNAAADVNPAHALCQHAEDRCNAVVCVHQGHQNPGGCWLGQCTCVCGGQHSSESARQAATYGARVGGDRAQAQGEEHAYGW